MKDFLSVIRDLTQKRVAAAREFRQLSASDDYVPRDFVAALREAKSPCIIAEVKRASPSRGAIAIDLDPVEVAREYLESGAAAISVLTEETYFGGKLSDLSAIRRAFPEAILLMKDFILDYEQIKQAREAGADAILLMVSLLGAEAFIDLFHKAKGLGLTPLVEVHDEDEMSLAAAVGARLIGINNRDFKSLEVSLDVTRRLSRLKSKGAVLVSESGITSRRDIDELRALGCDAFLVGTALMAGGRPGLALRDLLQRRLEIKICGITQVSDALLSAELGATMIGLIFTKDSPRFVEKDRARDIVGSLKAPTKAVGVFTREWEVLVTLDSVELHGVQCHGFEPSAQLLAELKARKVFSVRGFSVDRDARKWEIESSGCDHILLDSPKNGGLPLTSETIQSLDLARPYWLAGGLSLETIGAQMRALRPVGIDLARAVESRPGIKCETKLRAFFKALEGSGI